MIHIFQILGNPKSYKEKEFVIKDTAKKSHLCSDALRNYLIEKSEDVKLTFFIPESLLINENLDDLKEKLNEKGLVDFDLIMIPSVGEYGEIKYVTGIEAISTTILLHFIKNRPEKFYIDVSTGFNIYPINMLEAVKRYLTYRKLERILQGDCKVEAFTVFPPPITDAYSYPVETQPIDVKVFFSLPNANIDKIVKRTEHTSKIAELGKKFGKLKKEFRRMINELTIGMNAIKLNVPLAFYEILDTAIDSKKVEAELIKYVEELLEPIGEGSKIERLPIDGVNVANMFYSIALYRSIQEFKSTLNEPEIEEIYKNFSKVYRLSSLGVGVNEYFLERDKEDIKIHAKKLKDGEKDLLGNIKYGNLRKSLNAKRNFFAHSGFLEECTYVEVSNGKIYISWDKAKMNEIRKWILYPEKL
ncbi:MAG: hypothetical protein DSY33_01285 [Archaeoglobus sp.]|nr:MAG: hypothetical protein DSY33_01285 [Archaeoglobus sp.]